MPIKLITVDKHFILGCIAGVWYGNHCIMVCKRSKVWCMFITLRPSLHTGHDIPRTCTGVCQWFWWWAEILTLNATWTATSNQRTQKEISLQTDIYLTTIINNIASAIKLSIHLHSFHSLQHFFVRQLFQFIWLSCELWVYMVCEHFVS